MLVGRLGGAGGENAFAVMTGKVWGHSSVGFTDVGAATESTHPSDPLVHYPAVDLERNTQPKGEVKTIGENTVNIRGPISFF